jgi:site-specific recombinase XerD
MTPTMPIENETDKPKLLDVVHAKLRLKHYSVRTEQTYAEWIKRFIRFHQMRHPKEMGEREVAAFLTDLAVAGKVASSTQNQALSALLFLYKDVLEQPLEWVEGVERAKTPQRIPLVFTREEAQARVVTCGAGSLCRIRPFTS